MRKLQIFFLVVSVTLLESAFAQRQPPPLCNGFLAPPVAAINFGAGSNPGAALPRGTTTYRYRPYCAVSDNEYTILNNSLNCRANWYAIPADHTPNDNDGYFMLVDGSSAAGVFYTTIVSGLIPGFTYQFSAWGGNIDVSPDFHPANIQFVIDDVNGNRIALSPVIVVGFTSPFQWNQAGFTFQLPANLNAVRLSVVLVSGGAEGNDLVLDDIEFSPCYPPINASFSNTALVVTEKKCNNGSVNLYGTWPTPTGNPFANTVYQWERSADDVTWVPMPGGNTQNFSATENTPGVYKYRVIASNANNLQQKVTSNVITFRVLRIVVNPSTFPVYACNSAPVTIYIDSRLDFDDPANPITQPTIYNWTPSTYLSNATIYNPTISPPPQAAPNPAAPAPAPIVYTYQVSVSNSLGCSDQNTVTVNYFNPRKVAVPNAFTPDGNGVNDTFRPINLEDYPGGKFWVYNRWGQLVFFSPGPDYRWDGTYQGTPQPIDSYVWVVEMPFCNTNITPLPNSNGVSTGTVNLIR